jgi:predicted amino acid racemase
VTSPYLTIDLGRIAHNSRVLVDLCRRHGIRVTGVTKAVCGEPGVARAMLEGGVESIADSRLENLERLRRGGIEAPLMMLRLPSLSGADRAVELADVSLDSELAVLERLSKAALDRERVHEVIPMVDLGDLREGLMPDELMLFLDEALTLPGIRVVGLGTNLCCFSGVVPTEANMALLAALAERVEAAFGLRLPMVSGLNSSGLDLIASGRVPPRVDHARIGEAILLGRETTHRRPWPGTHQDAFLLHAEVLELEYKPSAPVGALGEDAFGGAHGPGSTGRGWRALLNVGRQDVDPEGLACRDPRFRIVGASSDYLALDVSAAREGEIRVGSVIPFAPNYSALLRAMTSPYVRKEPTGGAP